MRKIGYGKIGEEDCRFIYYTGKGCERVDISPATIDYSPVDTTTCFTSTIFDGTTRVFGNKSFLSTYNKIKNDASSLQCAENQTVDVEDGVIVFTISKKDPAGLVEYTKQLRNGKLFMELYKTPDGCIKFDSISDAVYNPKDKPVNWEDYEEEVLVRTTGLHKKTNAQFYSCEELLKKFPQVRHVYANDYIVIANYEEATERLKIWIESKEQLKSYDIESTGTDWGPTSQCRITGVFLGLGETWSTYFPFRQDNFDYNLPIEFLRTIFDAINNQPPAPEVILLAHNVKFEIQGFYQEFRDFVRCDCDTYLLSILINPVMQKGLHTLKSLTAKVDHNFYLSLSDIFIGPVQFNVLPPEIVLLYGCPDATSPAKIYKYLMSKLPKDERFVLSLENQLPVIKAMNEFYGMKLDQERLEELIRITEEDSENLANLFKMKMKTNGNINSPELLRDLIYVKLRCPIKLRTNKQLPSTSKIAIEGIIKSGKFKPDDSIPEVSDLMSVDGKHVLVKGADLRSNKYAPLLIYQQYKLQLKKLGALRRLKNKSVAGFFKFYINQSGAGSNRQTSDAHQFDDTMKSCAVADSPHHQLVSCDWKQVELRILAGLAGQKDLIEMEKDPELDIHRAILAIIQKKQPWEISEEARKKGKSVNFGVVYGMTEYGLANRDFGIGYTTENLNEERQKITDFFNGLPNVKEYIKSNEVFLETNGYIKTAFNYYRYFPEILNPDTTAKRKRSIIRQGGNTPIQGTGAQMLKIVERKVWDYMRKKGWDREKDYDGIKLPMARMIVPIHDEILFSYDKTIPIEEIITMFKECMELEIDDMPPFYAAPAFISNWYDGKDSKWEIDITFRDKIVEEYKKGNYLLTGKDYLKTLTDYRQESVDTYLQGLINKYHTVDAVADHVRDPVLTHTVIENMIPDKDDRKKYTHLERIHEAVRRYMENGFASNVVVTNEEKAEDADDKMNFEEFLDEVVQVDQYGEIIENEKEDEDEDVDVYDTDLDTTNCSTCKVLYTVNECLVDMSTATEEQFAKIQTLCNPDEFYKLLIMRDGRVVDTNLHIGYIQDQIEDILKEEINNG